MSFLIDQRRLLFWQKMIRATSDNIILVIITVDYIAVCCKWQFVWHYNVVYNSYYDKNWPSGILCIDDMTLTLYLLLMSREVTLCG